jgi:radical SAM superfamily enzyme YgiQ (UPF0313 family)
MNWKNVLCVYPYRTDPLFRFWRIPPIGLEIVASAIKPLVDNVEIIDMRFEGDANAFIKDKDLICFSLNWGNPKAIGGSSKFDLEFVFNTINSVPKGKTVVAGGRFATDYADMLLKELPRIDIIIRGYGEDPMVELFKKGSPAGIEGISYRDGGKIIHNKDRNQLVITGTYPDRSLRKYRYTALSMGVDSIYASQGCPFKCIYCEFTEKKWLSRSAESIIEELKTMDEDVEIVFFTDNNVFHDMDRMDKLCDAIKREGIKKRYLAQCRVESLVKRPDVIKKLGETGFLIGVGIESFNEDVLRWLKKGYRPDLIWQAFENVRKTDILALGFFIIGNYKETREDMLRTADLAKMAGLDFINVSRLLCYPKTELYSIMSKLPDYHIDENRNIVYSDYYSIKDLSKIRKAINRRFYSPLHLLRTFSRFSYHFNVLRVLRQMALEIILRGIFKKGRWIDRFLYLTNKYNIFYPIDFVFNTILKAGGRLLDRIASRRAMRITN